MTEQLRDELQELIIKDRPAFFERIRNLAIDNPKLLRAIALLENTLMMADLTVEHAKLRYSKKKRIFRKRDRTTKRFKKQERAIKLAVNSMQIRMSIIKQMQIASSPQPKFPKGYTNDNEGLSYVGGERGEEMVIPYEKHSVIPVPKSELIYNNPFNTPDQNLSFGTGKTIMP